MSEFYLMAKGINVLTILDQIVNIKSKAVLTFPTQTKFHHFGTLNASSHTLEKPIWVSHIFKVAEEYKNFGVKAPYYTELTASQDIKVADLKGVRLQSIAADLKIYDHSEWNLLLSEYILKNNLDGIIYADNEILLAKPDGVINKFLSSAT